MSCAAIRLKLGKHFDPWRVEIFRECQPELLEIRQRCSG